MAGPHPMRGALDAPLAADGVPLPARDADGRLRSPCICVCTMDAASGLCRGCLRRIDEIAGWGSASDAAKADIWRALVQRRRAGAA